MAAATSSGLPGRFSMVPRAAWALCCSTLSPAAAMRRSWNGVKIGPGPTAFTRMPSGEWSAASARVKPATAALVVSYCRLPQPATTERTEATLTIAPPLLRRISGTAALATHLNHLGPAAGLVNAAITMRGAESDRERKLDGSTRYEEVR